MLLMPSVSYLRTSDGRSSYGCASSFCPLWRNPKMRKPPESSIGQRNTSHEDLIGKRDDHADETILDHGRASRNLETMA
jgi:hypothetical protein